MVDNESGDGTAELVDREFGGRVELIRAGSNLGFGRANNLALAALDGDFVLLLNPDCEIEPGALEALLALIERRHEVGMVGPRLEQPDGEFDHAAARAFPTPTSALGHFSGIGRRSEPGGGGPLAAYRAAADLPGPIDAINGAFMLIRRAALDQVGHFDERYWMYMEDLDLSWRFAISGWISWYEPSVRVGHHKGGTAGRPRGVRLNRAFHAGMRRFYRDHYAARRGPLTNLAVEAAISAKLAISLLRSAPTLSRRALGARVGGTVIRRRCWARHP